MVTAASVRVDVVVQGALASQPGAGEDGSREFISGVADRGDAMKSDRAERMLEEQSDRAAGGV